jgi:hypothetical protein
MTFAAVTYVDLEGWNPAQGLEMLNDMLVPRLKAMPGFQSARFLRSPDGMTGFGTAVCDSQGHARECLSAMTDERPAGAPRVTSSAIYEVVLEV